MLLIEAIAQARQQRGQFPQRWLAMVPMANVTSRWSGSLGLQDAVTFAGRLPAREAFRRGRVLVIPSRNESFPYVVLEAMAAGVPVFASDVGGIAEALPPECLVPATDVLAIARCISKRHWMIRRG